MRCQLQIVLPGPEAAGVAPGGLHHDLVVDQTKARVKGPAACQCDVADHFGRTAHHKLSGLLRADNPAQYPFGIWDAATQVPIVADVVLGLFFHIVVGPGLELYRTIRRARQCDFVLPY